MRHAGRLQRAGESDLKNSAQRAAGSHRDRLASPVPYMKRQHDGSVARASRDSKGHLLAAIELVMPANPTMKQPEETMSNPFDTLFKDLSNPDKLKEFAAEPGEKDQRPDKAEFVKKERMNVLREAIIALVPIMAKGPNAENAECFDREIFKRLGIDSDGVMELAVLGKLISITRDDGLKALAEIRGRTIIVSALDSIVEKRWLAQQPI